MFEKYFVNGKGFKLKLQKKIKTLDNYLGSKICV